MKTTAAYREDCRTYPFILKQEGLASATDHLRFMTYQGFLTDAELEWWVGAGTLRRFLEAKVQRTLRRLGVIA